MKRTVLRPAVCLLVAATQFACTWHLPITPPEEPGAWRYLQFGSDGADEGRALAAALGGGVVVAGVTTGSLHPRVTPQGGEDIFLIRYSAFGEKLWTRQYGTGGADRPEGVGFDAAGNVYVGGYTAGDLFATADPTAGGSGWLVKYTPSGVVIWTHQFGTEADEDISGFAVDPAGNCYLAGTTSGALYGDNQGGRDAFLACYGPDGRLRWGRQFGSTHPYYPADDAATRVAADGSGVYVAGTVMGLLFPGSPTRQDDNGLRTPAADAFVARYSPDGSRLWDWQADFAPDIGLVGDEEYLVLAAAGGTIHLVLQTCDPTQSHWLVSARFTSQGCAWRGVLGRVDASDGMPHPGIFAACAGTDGTVSFTGEADAYAGPFAGYGARMFFAQTDQSGVRWLHDLGAMKALDLKADPAGGFLLTGSMDGAGGRDGFLARADAEGRINP